MSDFAGVMKKAARLKRHWTPLVVPIFLLCLLVLQPGVNRPAFAAENEAAVPLEKQFSLAAKVKRLFNSHTSYEFGNPFPPYQKPLSRLEYPLDSWWGGAELKAQFGRFSVGVEAFRNVSDEADGKMKDSDWDDDERPAVRTIYSESKCRLEASYLVRADLDVEIADLLGSPQWFSLRPVVGFRWQDLNFVTHDGVQSDIGDPGAPLLLPGDGIAFSQSYWHYFIGVRTNLDAGRLLEVGDLHLFLQADWAYVEGGNRDHHLLRAGTSFTYDDTDGHAWHVAMGLRKSLYKAMSLALETEYLWIRTTGTHRFVNDAFGLDLSWSDGVKVWSEQASVSLSLEYLF